MKDDHEKIQRKYFEFISQDFQFNSSTVILSWANYMEDSCSNYVEYFLVKSLNGRSVKKTFTGQLNMVVLLHDDLATRDGRLYYFYVEARNGSGNICATTFTEIQINPRSKYIIIISSP